MTKINDYIWQLPHTPTDDDPSDVATLIQVFNNPIVSILEKPLKKMGYKLRSSDVIVPPDQLVIMAEMDNIYKANVRFIKYISKDVIARIHFEHDEWNGRLPQADQHIFVVNLDCFKFSDKKQHIVDKNWDGRKHAQMSSEFFGSINATGRDVLWVYNNQGELEGHLDTFMEKFKSNGKNWLEG